MVSKIEYLCKYHGKTLVSLENECGLKNGTIYKWDKNLPSIDKALAVADALRVSVHDLMNEDDVPEGPSPQFIRRTELLSRQGISLSELSKKSGMSVYRLRRYFSEDTLGDTDFLHEYPKLARALGVSPQYLHCLTDQENDESDTDERFCDWVMGHLSYEKKEEPTPVPGDGLSEEQREILSLFDAAPQALRAAALAVLKSAEGQGKVPGGSSTGE